MVSFLRIGQRVRLNVSTDKVCVHQVRVPSLDTMTLRGHNAKACSWSYLLVAPAVECDEEVRPTVHWHVHALSRADDSGLLESRESNTRYELSSVRLRIKLRTAEQVVVVRTSVRNRVRVAVCACEVAVRNLVQVTVRSRSETVAACVQVPVFLDRCVEDDVCDLADSKVDRGQRTGERGRTTVTNGATVRACCPKEIVDRVSNNSAESRARWVSADVHCNASRSGCRITRAVRVDKMCRSSSYRLTLLYRRSGARGCEACFYKVDASRSQVNVTRIPSGRRSSLAWETGDTNLTRSAA